MKRVSIVLLGILLCVLLAGCKCEHEWAEATCTEPKTCTKCKETEGKPLGHNWKAATCEEPETCTRCGETRGNAKGHTWKDATCTEPKTCTVCGKTEGEVLGHKEGDWEVAETDVVSATKVLKKYCTVCGEEVDRKTQDLDSLHNDGKFLFTPKEFVERFNNELSSIDQSSLIAVSGSSAGHFACAILNTDSSDTSNTGFLLFVDDEATISKSQENEVCLTGALGRVENGDKQDVAIILVSVISTCDPSLGFSEAKDLAAQVLDEKEVTQNGITYIFSDTNNGMIVCFSLED